MPIGTAGLIGISTIAGLADALFGQEAESMTPEQRQALEFVWAELKKTDTGLGFSTTEKQGLVSNLRTNALDFAEQQTGRALASNARRGPVSPGQTAGITTDILSGAGKAFTQGVSNINLASAEAGRQRRGQLTSILPGLTQGRTEQGGGFGQDLVSFIQNLAFNSASRRRQAAPAFG